MREVVVSLVRLRLSLLFHEMRQIRFGFVLSPVVILHLYISGRLQCCGSHLLNGELLLILDGALC